MTHAHDVTPTPNVKDAILAVADVLLPGTAELPSASTVGDYLGLLDRVLRVDPSLEPTVHTAAEHAAVTEGELHFALVQSWMAADDLERLVFALHAAYYMARDVRALLRYPGQGRFPVAEATPDQLTSDDLLAPVIERGAVFVPTPIGRSEKTNP